MYKTLVVIGHPNLTHSYVNRTWREALRPYEDEKMKVHVLHEATDANGCFDVVAEQRRIEEADRVILQFPLYWYTVPKLMKQWLEDVFLEGWCYGENGNKLEGKTIECIVSCGAPEVAFKTITLREYLRFIDGIAGFVRAKVGEVFALYDVESSDKERLLVDSLPSYIDFVMHTNI